MKFKIGQKVRVVSNDKTKSLGYQMHPKIGSIVKITGYDEKRKLYLIQSGLIDIFVSDEDLEEIKGCDIGDVWENQSYEYKVVHSFEHSSKKDTKVLVIQRREFGKDDLEYFTEERYEGD